jgi:hypothetical protein
VKQASTRCGLTFPILSRNFQAAFPLDPIWTKIADQVFKKPTVKTTPVVVHKGCRIPILAEAPALLRTASERV